MNGYTAPKYNGRQSTFATRVNRKELMRAQENQLHNPFGSLLQVLASAISRLAPRRRMAPLDKLDARPPTRYAWHAVQAGMDTATCGACPPGWSAREWSDDSKS